MALLTEKVIDLARAYAPELVEAAEKDAEGDLETWNAGYACALKAFLTGLQDAGLELPEVAEALKAAESRTFY